jgi:hypothetical protein
VGYPAADDFVFILNLRVAVNILFMVEEFDRIP